MPFACTAAPACLDAAQLSQFHELGYVVLERFLDDELNQTLKSEVDRWASGGALDPYAAPTAPTAPAADDKPRLQLDLPEHGRLISHPPLMTMLAQIMGEGFAYHHLHTARHDAGAPGVSWHHDYEQLPQSNRSHVMVHVFYYLNGLDGTIGDLLVLPKSHRAVMDRGALNQFETQDLPGSVTIDRLPPGTAVIVHSALLHARRPKPGDEGRARYFIDASYCQKGVRWPCAYLWRTMLARALELGLDRDGRHAHLFDSEHFFDQFATVAKLQPLLQGSVGHRLVGDS